MPNIDVDSTNDHSHLRAVLDAARSRLGKFSVVHTAAGSR